MKTKHTPGPWKLHNCDEAFITIQLDNTGQLIDVIGRDSEANAKLVVAAPDLLETLMAIVDAQYNPEKSLANLNSAIANGKRAIRKATE